MMPRWRMAMGNLGCGDEESQRRKVGWGAPWAAAPPEPVAAAAAAAQ